MRNQTTKVLLFFDIGYQSSVSKTFPPINFLGLLQRRAASLSHAVARTVIAPCEMACAIAAYSIGSFNSSDASYVVDGP